MLSDFKNEFGNGFVALEISFIVVYLTTPIAANYQYTSVEFGHQTLHGDINFLSPASAFKSFIEPDDLHRSMSLFFSLCL